jgi:hypothetical protein
MLGRLRRTTRTDVGLALAFAGVGYLVWALVAGNCRNLVEELINSAALRGTTLPALTQSVNVMFRKAGVVIDVVGLLWLVATLLLVVYSSRQKISISWAWVSAVSQTAVAALGAVLVGWAAYAPHAAPPSGHLSTWEKVSGVSLPVIVAVALVIWVTFLVWLLVERARFNRRGPTLGDGVRSHMYR